VIPNAKIDTLQYYHADVVDENLPDLRVRGDGACTLAIFGTCIEGTFELNVVNNSDVTDSMIHNVISMEDNPAYQRRQLDCGGA
jgi:hypothetical protein